MKLWDLSLHDCIDAWDEYDKGGTYLPGIRALAQLDRFYLLVKVLGRTDVLHPWIYARCREVERASDGYLDLWAREHYKSTLITYAGIIQQIINDAEVTIGIFSHTKTIARGFVAQIKRELESNENLKRIFPDILWSDPQRQSPSWSLDNGLIVKRQGNPKEATLEGWGLIDGQPTSKHFRLRVYDDVVTRESVYTPGQIETTTDAFSLSQSLGVEGGRVWGIGTRYSYADTYQWIIDRGALKPRVYAATDNGLTDGKPVLFSPEEWANRLRSQTDADIACQYLQNPIAGENRMFDISDLQVYEARPETLNVYVLVDPARSKKKDSAETAVIVVGLDYAANKYLLDGFAHRMDLQERWARMRDMVMKWRYAAGVQSLRVGYEVYGAQADMDYFNERMRVEGKSFAVEELTWPREGEGSKLDRVQRLVPDMRMHKIFLPYATDEANLTRLQRDMMGKGYQYRIARPIKRKDSDGNVYDLSEKFRQQVHYFPFGGLKDCVDAFARIYDIDPSPPQIVSSESLEPEVV